MGVGGADLTIADPQARVQAAWDKYISNPVRQLRENVFVRM